MLHTESPSTDTHHHNFTTAQLFEVAETVRDKRGVAWFAVAQSFTHGALFMVPDEQDLQRAAEREDSTTLQTTQPQIARAAAAAENLVEQTPPNVQIISQNRRQQSPEPRFVARRANHRQLVQETAARKLSRQPLGPSRGLLRTVFIDANVPMAVSGGAGGGLIHAVGSSITTTSRHASLNRSAANTTLAILPLQPAVRPTSVSGRKYSVLLLTEAQVKSVHRIDSKSKKAKIVAIDVHRPSPQARRCRHKTYEIAA